MMHTHEERQSEVRRLFWSDRPASASLNQRFIVFLPYTKTPMTVKLSLPPKKVDNAFYMLTDSPLLVLGMVWRAYVHR